MYMYIVYMYVINCTDQVVFVKVDHLLGRDGPS